MQHRAGAQSGLAIDKNDAKLVGWNDGIAREGPLVEVGVTAGQRKTVQSDGIGAVVKEFNPGLPAAGVVLEPGGVVRLDFVEPKHWVGSNCCRDGVRRA